jgi:hypothetical protein
LQEREQLAGLRTRERLVNPNASGVEIAHVQRDRRKPRGRAQPPTRESVDVREFPRFGRGGTGDERFAEQQRMVRVPFARRTRNV